MMESSADRLYFNGINAVTGDYDLAPLPPAELASILVGHELPESSADNLSELRYRYQQSRTEHFGAREGVNPKQLNETGWGIIFAHDADPDVKDALSELINLRRAQAGENFRIYEGGDGYRPDETKTKFLARHGAGPGPADPEKVPYYLLIVGDPEKIPYSFQTQLDVQYAVGRIHFNTLDEYANYAKSVVTAESGRIRLPRKATFFGVANHGDRATQLSSEILVEPVYEMLREQHPEWDIAAYMREQATKSQLATLLGGDQTPAFLMSASHGIAFPSGDAQQLPYQGALLCQDWPGPGSGSIAREWYFAGQDLPADANLLGLIAFFFACFGGGTPRLDQFAKEAGRQERQQIAPRNFLARLPAAMLSQSSGGALAVVGQVDRAWGYSFMWPGAGAQTEVFLSTFRRLLEGHPIGSAVEYLNERYAELSTVLSDILEEIDFGMPADAYELAGLWTANNDARGLTIIGDPAVRLPVASLGEERISGRRPEQIDMAGPEKAPALIVTSRPTIQQLEEQPKFIEQLQSSKEDERAKGLAEALKIVDETTEIRKKILEDENLDEDALPDAEKEVLQKQRALDREVSRLTNVATAQEGEYADGERETALSILESLGSKAGKRTLDKLKTAAKDEHLAAEIRAMFLPAIMAIDNDPLAKQRFLESQLREGDPPIQRAVMEWLPQFKPVDQETQEELWRLVQDDEVGALAVETLFAVEPDAAKLMSETIARLGRGTLQQPRTQAALGTAFLEEGKAMREAWVAGREQKKPILSLILATMSEGDPEARHKAVDWLATRAQEVPSERLDGTIAELTHATLTEDEAPIREQINKLSDVLTERKKFERNVLERDLRHTDSSVRFEAIKRAAEAKDEWPLRILIKEWVRWIASGKSTDVQFIEETAQRLRGNEIAVLPLLNALTQDFQPTDELVKDVKETVSTLTSGEVDGATIVVSDEGTEADQELRKRIITVLEDELNNRESNVYQTVLKRMSIRTTTHLDDEAIRRLIVTYIQAELKERELWVHRRISRQLSEMSNPHYFEETAEGARSPEHEAIKRQLTRYGVPVLARILPESDDDEVRENLAYTLGNVGGRESIDALARAVVGEERTRANRQKLLSTYYLEPSKQRSDEASDILKGAVTAAKRTLLLQQLLNVLVLVVGLLILIGGLLFASQSTENAQRIAGILVGLGGFAGILIKMVTDPLDRIQNAMANLVQLETAFTSFIWELNLNGTYIQSQYVAEGILTEDDVAETVARIEDAMSLTLDQVAVYTDEGRQILVPHITSLSPVVGKPGTTIVIYGQYLMTDLGNGKDRQKVAVAINHIPITANDLSKERNIVEFQLPNTLPAGLNGESNTLWVSLVINGRETNSLPFQLTSDSSEPPDS